MQSAKHRTALVAALRDLALVVIGVMLALAAEDWREERQSEDEAKQTATLLLAELEADAENLRGIRSRFPRRDSAGAVLLSRGAELPADSALAALWSLRFHSSYTPSRAAFDRLVQSEGLRHIGSSELQAHLVRYFENHQAAATQVYDYWLALQNQFAEATFPYINITPVDFAEAMGLQSRMEHSLAEPWQQVAADVVLTNRIWYTVAAQNVLEGAITIALEANDRLQIELRRELFE